MLEYRPGFLAEADALTLLEELRARQDWHQPEVRMFGRRMLSPRLSVFVAGQGLRYRYSGKTYSGCAWTSGLEKLCTRLKKLAGRDFNSVLLNHYRSGNDAMGWHADDEPELGPEPVIASVSLGATRRFKLKHRYEAGRQFEIELDHGSTLIMYPPCQAEWRHSIPRVRQAGERFNLTFRQIS